MSFSKRHADHELERRLRADRPEPGAELTQAISDRVRPRRRRVRGGLHVPLGLAGGVSAIVLTVAIAFGGGAATVSPTTAAPPAQTQNTALFGGFGPVRVVVPPPQATINQYGNRRTICVLGLVTLTVPRIVATLLVAIGVARYGPC